jgi:hypothetical protein
VNQPAKAFKVAFDVIPCRLDTAARYSQTGEGDLAEAAERSRPSESLQPHVEPQTTMGAELGSAPFVAPDWAPGYISRNFRNLVLFGLCRFFSRGLLDGLPELVYFLSKLFGLGVHIAFFKGCTPREVDFQVVKHHHLKDVCLVLA